MEPTYLQSFLSDSARVAKRSEFRELLELISRPEVISLAGGLPSPETFPLEECADIAADVIRGQGRAALQYGPTEGDAGLVSEIVGWLATQNDYVPHPEEVLVTSASQQGLDLVSRVFLAPGDSVLCSLPTYLGALGAFTACGAQLTGVPIDEDGMRTDRLEECLLRLRRRGLRPKIVYVVPDFQNPAGVTLTTHRRRELLAIASEFDVLVLEDAPYRQLRYRGDDLPSLKSLDREGRVISLQTFSKILFPGLRLGWVTADPEIVARLVDAKRPVDLCTGSFVQAFAREVLRRGLLPPQIERSKALYSRKLSVMLGALEEEIDPVWGVRWTKPEGGLFLWLWLPREWEATELLHHALEENVGFVCGSAFHCDGGGNNTLRLNFSYPTSDQLRLGVRRLAKAIDRLRRTRSRPARPAREEVYSPEVSESSHSLEQLAWNLGLTEIVE